MKLETMITGSNIRLRSMTAEDLPLKVRWYNDPEVRETLIVDEIFELEKTRQWFETTKNLESRLDLTIETNAGMPIGLISLINIDHKQKMAEIILVIGNKEYWGKGVMLEAESLLIQYAFENLRIEKIWAQARPENIASLITMKKLGFQIEGTLRKEKVIVGQRIDVVHLGLLPEDFKPAKFLSQ